MGAQIEPIDCAEVRWRWDGFLPRSYLFSLAEVESEPTGLQSVPLPRGRLFISPDYECHVDCAGSSYVVLIGHCLDLAHPDCGEPEIARSLLRCAVEHGIDAMLSRTDDLFGRFGLIARLILLGVQTAGSVIALQIGIASALVADPTTQQQAAVTGNFLLALTIVLIFASGLDHMTLRGLVNTYAIFPPGQVPLMGDVADHGARIVADSFAVAMAMTAPFLVYGIVFAVALGLLARLMPTLQVFFIAMPAQILVGFALMAVGLTAMMLYFLSSYEERMSLFLGGG